MQIVIKNCNNYIHKIRKPYKHSNYHSKIPSKYHTPHFLYTSLQDDTLANARTIMQKRKTQKKILNVTLQTLDFQFLDKKEPKFYKYQKNNKNEKNKKTQKHKTKEESNVKHFPPDLRSIVNVYTTNNSISMIMIMIGVNDSDQNIE